MSKGSFNPFEQHIEKIALGLGGAFLLYMGWAYLVNSPNVASYNGQPVMPSEVDESIYKDARNLEEAVRRAEPKKTETPKYAEQVKHAFAGGVLGAPNDGAPPLATTLRRAAGFGTSVEYPGGQGGGDVGAAVAVVTPLAPSEPVVRTGRSIVYPMFNKLPPTGSGSNDETLETSWVHVAAYFPIEEQKKEMQAAGYSLDKQRVYIAKVEAQRQELLPSGEWSDWSDVTDSRAAIKYDTEEPEIDAASGAMKNGAAVRATFTLVQSYQHEIMQPQFHTVNRGDPWGIPDLPGLETHAPSASQPTGPGGGPFGGPPGGGPPGAVPPGGGRGGRPPDEPPGGGVPPPPPPPPSGGGGRGAPPAPPGGGGGLRPPGGGGGLRPPGGPGGPAQPSGSQNQKAQARKQAEADYKEAEKAVQQKEWERAASLVEQVLSNADAENEIKRKAQRLKDKIDKHAEGGGPKPVILPPGGELMKKSDGTPAIWFTDDSVTAGKTYRYRMRVKLWNRYVGQLRGVKSPDDAKQLLLAGAWSEPTEAFTVSPASYFFVRGAKNSAGNSANVEVWKWHEGDWIKEQFDVAAGDAIGGMKKRKSGSEIDFSTGMVVLDVRKEMNKPRKTGKDDQGFSWSPESETVVVTYMDPTDGQVKERTAASYRNDPVRKQLEDKEKAES